LKPAQPKPGIICDNRPGGGCGNNRADIQFSLSGKRARDRKQWKGGQWQAALVQQDVKEDRQEAKLFDQSDNMVHRLPEMASGVPASIP
jgi:hypothetical protein